jgi:hypothetical protein
MADAGKSQDLSPSKQQFLQQMGSVIAAEFEGFSIDVNGVVSGAFGKWIPIENAQPLDTLFKAMRLAGLDPNEFQYQQYQVLAANPYHGNAVDLEFPAQMVIKSYRYAGIHEVDLIMRNPFVTAIEIQTSLKN